jgi:hypothetical protein
MNAGQIRTVAIRDPVPERLLIEVNKAIDYVINPRVGCGISRRKPIGYDFCQSREEAP